MVREPRRPDNAGVLPIVRRPARVRGAWLNAAGVAALLDSPARRTIASRLLAGDSAVWVLLECGDGAKDRTATEMLEAQLTKLTTELQLPEPAEDDPQMRSALPLKIAFSMVRIRSDAPAERSFIAQLLHGRQSVGGSEPVAVAVFGRGRAMPALSGQQLTADMIAEVCVYICGECSCEVKAANPGKDLLLAADWDAVVDGRPPRELSLAVFVQEPQPTAAPARRLGAKLVFAAATASAVVLVVVLAWARTRRVAA